MFQSSATHQFLATVCVNLMSISYGTTAGWPSSAFLVLKSEQLTPLAGGALSDEQLSWIGALMGIGGLVGSVLFGWLSDWAGRKQTLCLLAFPAIISWFLIIFATCASHLYVSRFLGGLSAGGSFVLVPLFVAEIAEDRIRGSLGSLMMMSANFGILLAFVAGDYLPFAWVPRLFVCVPIVFVLTVLWFPETPFYFMRTNRELKAIASLEFYRNIRTHDDRGLVDFDGEMEKLKTVDLNGDTEIRVPLCVHDFTNRAARKAFLIGIVLIVLHECCGCFTMINYTATIFAQSGSQIPPQRAAIFVAFVQLLGTFVSTRLVDRSGRRCLLLCSSLGTGCSLLTLGAFMYAHECLGWPVEQYSWLAVGSFAAMLLLASCGIVPLPFVVLAEVMPERIRGAGSTLCLCVSWSLVFGMVKVFPATVLAIGLHGCMFAFAGCCFAGALFVLVVLPETRGKSYEQIVAEFMA